MVRNLSCRNNKCSYFSNTNYDPIIITRFVKPFFKVYVKKHNNNVMNLIHQVAKVLPQLLD